MAFMYETISTLIKSACTALSFDAPDFTLSHPADIANGDYAVNVALIIAKQKGMNPQEVAAQLKAEI